MKVLLVAVLLLATGCSATVAGSATGQPDAPATTTRTTTTTTRTTSPRPPTTSTKTPVAAPPTSIDPDAAQQYCDNTITGALGKRMVVVVVQTPNGRANCDQAAAVLVDYYAKRPTPDPGSTPIEVDAFACNQVPTPDFPQVICADGTSLIYSMWPQGG